MILFVTKAEPNLAAYESPHLGRLVQPRHYPNLPATVAAGRPWAADNDAFNGFNRQRYEQMLAELPRHPGCTFVTAPDVVADAVATLALAKTWIPELQSRGLPIAFVAQDGAKPSTLPWSDIDALFVGGNTDYKLGPDAAELAREAKRRNLWVHMGRVNSRKRIRYAHSIGCDSIDGTSFSMFSNTHIPWALALLAELDSMSQPELPFGTLP